MNGHTYPPIPTKAKPTHKSTAKPHLPVPATTYNNQATKLPTPATMHR
jgi:hypothetical protein